MLALWLLLGYVSNKDIRPEVMDFSDAWKSFQNFLRNFKVDIHFYSTGVKGWFLNQLCNCLKDKGAAGIACGLIPGMSIVQGVVNKITDRVRAVSDEDVADALNGQNSYYQIVVCLEDMNPNYPFRLDRLWNQRIILFTSVAGLDSLKTLSDEELEENREKIYEEVIVTLSKALKSLMMTHLAQDPKSLGKLMTINEDKSRDAIRLFSACKVYISGSGFAKHVDYIAFTNGDYYMQDVRIACCYAGVDCTFHVQEGREPSVFSDYVMTDMTSYAKLLEGAGSVFNNFGIVGSGELTKVNKVTYDRESWRIEGDYPGDIPVSKVQGQLSIMLIKLTTGPLSVTMSRAESIHLQTLNLSIQDLFSLATDLLPDGMFDFNLPDFAQGLASTPSLGSASMKVTFDDTWQGKDDKVSIILEGNTEEDVEAVGTPSSVTIQKTRISDRPKAPGPYFKLKGWQTALIVIAVVLVACYVPALLWAMFIRKKQPVPTWEHSGESAPTTTGTGGISITNNNNNNNNNQMGMMMMMGAAPRLQP